jgi:RNA polymerase sigma factor (sigma-70 family)
MFNEARSTNEESSINDRPVESVRVGRRLAPAAVNLICGLVVFSTIVDFEQIRSIQRYCTTCWSNARIDPGLWEDCTQEVCVRLLEKVRDGLNWSGLLESGEPGAESPERRELIRVVDAVRKKVQRSKRYLPLDDVVNSPSAPVATDGDHTERYALAELLRTARDKVLTPRQDKIIELWSHGAGIAEIAREIGLKVAQVSDEKYKAICKLEGFLAKYRDMFGFGSNSMPSIAC